MWLEKVIETKKAKGISTREMAERSKLHLTEKTITRILKRETEDPKISTILDLGETVGLSPQQIFTDTDLVPIDREEVERLKSQVSELSAENELLHLKLSHQEELLALHNHYNKLKQSND